MIFNNRRLSRALLATLILGLSSVAFAATADGTIAFSFSNIGYSAPGALMPTTLFTIGSMAVNGSGTGSFDCTTITTDSVCDTYGALLPTVPFAGDNMIGLQFLFNGGVTDGTPQYRYTVTSELPPITISGPTTFYNIQTNGIFTDLRGAGGFSTAVASLGMTFVQTCVTNAGCSVSGGGVFATPPAFSTLTPEPDTLGFLGLGLVGLGYLGRKKRKP